MTQDEYLDILDLIRKADLDASPNMICQMMVSLTKYVETIVPSNRSTRIAMHDILEQYGIFLETRPVPSEHPGGAGCCRATTTMKTSGKSSTPSSMKSRAAGGWQRGEPIGVLALLLRSGAERIETEAPAMRAHAGTMLVAADELEHLAAAVTGAFKSLEISQRQLETLAEPDE